jgi:spore coat protein H
MKLAAVSAAAACLAACGEVLPISGDDDDGGGGPDGGDQTPFEFVRCGPDRAPLPPLEEDRRVYDQEELDRWTVELVIEDLDAFADVNANVPGAEVEVVMIDGDFEATGTLSIRGGFSRFNAQKNYKIDLHDGARWHGQEEINLNKHMWDKARLRNKLSFDLMKTVPHLTSLRSNFVELLVNGEGFGLYTWIEEPDKKFLRSHGLDPDGQLYKSAIFWFQELDPEIAADPAMLELFIEGKANDDPAKLLEMLAAVNDPGQDIDDVMDRYFNRDNLVSWLAVNVLINNIDTRTQNFYIYSPSSCDGWYILPWDYDGAWGFYGPADDDARERWEYGLSNWWVSNLVARFYEKPENVAAIDARVAELREVITEEAVAERIGAYHDLVAPFMVTEPDIEYLPGRPSDPEEAAAEWEDELERITAAPTRFHGEYVDSLERPMPVHLGSDPRATGVRFTWDWSFDLQHDGLTYDLQVSRTPSFGAADLIAVRNDLTDNEAEVLLPPGRYYWRVVIEDHKGPDTWQAPYDPYEEVVVP